MADVIDISSKLERWVVAFESADLTVSVSSHGRLKLDPSKLRAVLSCTDMVRLVQGIIRAMAEHGFPPQPDPPADSQFVKGR